MIKVRRIGHATFDTTDLDKQVDYYTQVTGLALIAALGGFLFGYDSSVINDGDEVEIVNFVGGG